MKRFSKMSGWILLSFVICFAWIINAQAAEDAYAACKPNVVITAKVQAPEASFYLTMDSSEVFQFSDADEIDDTPEYTAEVEKSDAIVIHITPDPPKPIPPTI